MSIDEIKKNLKTKNLLIGTSVVMKNLRKGKLAKIFLSENCPENLKKDIMHHVDITKIEVEQLNIPNDELGVVCKKSFFISVIGLLK